MAIKLRCTNPNCQKRLQVPDKYAGRKVSCPDCKSVFVAPGERVPSAPAAPKAPAHAPLPPPPPPPRHEETTNPFGFGGRSGAEPRPAPKKSGLHEVLTEAKGNGRDDEDEGARPRPRQLHARGRGDPWRSPARAWAGFGAGCGVAVWGAWAEFVGFAVGATLAVYKLLFEARDDLGRAAADGLPEYLVLVPLVLGSAVGAGLAWLGRARMMGLPAGNGAKWALVASFLVTLARLFAVLAAVVLLALSFTEDAGGRAAENYLGLAALAWLVGALLWVVADQAVLPAAAMVGSALRNYPLSKRAGGSAVLLQVVGVLFVLLLVGRGAYVYSQADAVRAGRPGAVGPVEPELLEAATVGALLLLHLLYTLTFSSVYAASARAVRQARATDEDDD
ncbi:MAG: hypothetical protein C0501_02825 [Isosphaera sp.]|nr:hypothetical protein [Isosphaera sp.]